MESPTNVCLPRDSMTLDSHELDTADFTPAMGSRLSKQPKTDMIFKVIIVGDSGVGKTTVLRRLIRKKFESVHHATVGVEFCSHIVKIDDETLIKLQIWDTAGQESFKSIVNSFYRNSSCVFLVYDITRRSTFESLAKWVEDSRKIVDSDIIFILLGNLADKETEREVKYSEGESFMQANAINFFFETSAKSGQNIIEAFAEAGRLVFLNYINQLAKGADVTPSSIMRVNSGRLIQLSPVPKDESKNCAC